MCSVRHCACTATRRNGFAAARTRHRRKNCNSITFDILTPTWTISIGYHWTQRRITYCAALRVPSHLETFYMWKHTECFHNVSKCDCILICIVSLQLKIFPETSRTAVYSYLGIPYAQPPTGQLRFAVSLFHLISRIHSFHCGAIAKQFLITIIAHDSVVISDSFQVPKKHLGWANRTLTARDYKPICPQLTDYMFDEMHNGYAPHAIKTDEDCLFLNVWTPQVFQLVNWLLKYFIDLNCVLDGGSCW